MMAACQSLQCANKGVKLEKKNREIYKSKRTVSNIHNTHLIFHISIVSYFQTQVIFQHYVMGNSEENFTDASEFRPERWMRRTPAQTHHAFASLPFGFGKRMCLGRRFAELEIHTIICKVSFHRRLSSVRGTLLKRIRLHWRSRLLSCRYAFICKIPFIR